MTDTKPIEGAAMLPRSAIYPNPNQPRKSFALAERENLASSLREHGVLQPLLVRVKPSRLTGAQYMIIGGERRWWASEDVLEELPAIVKNVTDEEAAILALVDNIQRVDLTPLEEATAIRAMMEQYGYTRQQVAQRIGKERGEDISQGWVSNRLGLINTGEDVKEVAASKPNSMSSLLLVERVKEPETRAELLDMVRSGQPHLKVKARVEAHQSAEEHKARAAKYKAPDKETGERRQANERGESSSVSRGKRVTGPKRDEVRQEVERALKVLEVWVPLLSDADYETMVKPVARELLRGKLSR